MSGEAHEIRIEQAPPDLPFRWMVIIDDRKRGAVSVVAVLRQVRCGARARLREPAGAGDGLSAGADVIEGLVLTGFLGSGKTTLLGRLLRQPEFSRTAVIINEFGEIGLDHELDRGERGELHRVADRLPVLQGS